MKNVVFTDSALNNLISIGGFPVREVNIELVKHNKSDYSRRDQWLQNYYQI